MITEQCEELADEVALTPNENLLAFLNQKWNDYQVIITMIRDVLMYMVRVLNTLQFYDILSM